MRKIFFLTALLWVLPAGQVQAAPGQELPREVLVNGVEFVHVPEGWFWYGVENQDMATVGGPGRPYYRDVKVWLDGFYIGKYEARARDLQRFMNSDAPRHRADFGEAETEGCSVRRKPDGEYYQTAPNKDLPATNLSWRLAVEFAQWMGFRLPTEGEWIKAARGTDRRLWPWGDEYPDDTFAGYNSRWDCSPTPVDAFPNGRSPYGAYNMAGNAYEHVQDWYNDQWDLALKDGARNPPLADKSTVPFPQQFPTKIMHGGRWASPANGITIYRRNLVAPDFGFSCFGTRFAMDEAAMREHLAKGTATVLTQ